MLREDYEQLSRQGNLNEQHISEQADLSEAWACRTEFLLRWQRYTIWRFNQQLLPAPVGKLGGVV